MTAGHNEWELVNRYAVNGRDAECGEPDCAVGVYVIPAKSTYEHRVRTVTAACVTCEFAGPLTDVFNPDEDSYIPDAPECYRRAAATVLQAAGVHRGLAQAGRAATMKLIDEYPAT